MQRRREGRSGPGATSREANHRAVLESLALDGPRSRADLGRALGISAASVSRVVDGLLAAALVAEGARVAARIGRPQTLLNVNPNAAVVVGISVRSRLVRLMLAALDGRPLHRVAVERAGGPPEALVRQLRGLLTEARAAYASGREVGAVVVGLSGAWDADRRRVHAAPNLADYEGIDLAALLQVGFGDLVVGGAVDLDNDINLAALGEHAHGAARGVDDFFYLSLGTGVGGAAVIGGHLHRGVHGLAGELGYLPVALDGGVRTLEEAVGRRALERVVGETGVLREGEDVFARLARAGGGEDPVARHVSRYLAHALVAIVTTFDPRLVVLGGGMGRYSEAWTAGIRADLERLVPRVPRIVSTDLGRDASLLGAVARGTALARGSLLAARMTG